MSDLFSNNYFYGMHKEWPELDKFRFRRGRLLLVFVTIPEIVSENISIVRPRRTQLRVMEAKQNDNVVITAYLQPVLTSTYRNQSLLFSADECAGPEIVTKHFISIDTTTRYAQITLKKENYEESTVK